MGNLSLINCVAPRTVEGVKGLLVFTTGDHGMNLC